ncbi:MAG: cupin domain-containing protein [Candidatus Bathyarchaeia archaeon]
MKNYLEVEEEPAGVGGGEGVRVRWLISDATGINFAMRRYELSGAIPLHIHSHEHGVYVLEGQGEVTTSDEAVRRVGPGDFIFIGPNEPHGFKSAGKASLVFLCVVPRKRGETKILP